MTLYKPLSSPAQMAQSAMSAATQAAAAQTKQTTTTVKKESNVWDDIYKGAVSIAAVGRGINSLVGAADSAWNMYNEHKLRSAYDDVSKAFGEGGFESIQRNPDMQDYWHAQAVGQFVKDRASTEKGRLEMLKSMDEVADKQYQDWRIQAMTVNKAFKSGDMQQFVPLMEQLSAKSPLPYRLEGTQDGKFKILFRSDQHQGWTETGRLLTPQEAMNEVNTVLQGEQSILRGLDGKLHPVNPAFNAAAARYYWGTVMGNAENRIDPKKQIPLYDSSGNIAGMGVIQNPVDDYSAQPRLLVFDRRGRQVGMYDGMDGVFRAGMSPYKPQKQKGGGSGSGGGRVNSDSAKLIQTLATIKDADGKDIIDPAIASALTHAAQLGIHPYDARVRLDQQTEAALRAIKERNPHMPDDEAARHARSIAAQSLLGSPAAPQQKTATTGNDAAMPPQTNSSSNQNMHQENSTRTSPHTGKIVQYPKNGRLQWARIDENGNPHDISDDEAQKLTSRYDTPPVKRPSRLRAVTPADVWDELSDKEKSLYRKTGKLPPRYQQRTF